MSDGMRPREGAGKETCWYTGSVHLQETWGGAQQQRVADLPKTELQAKDIDKPRLIEKA